MRTAADELARRWQRATKRIKDGGHIQESGTEYVENRFGERHATFRVAFKGDQTNAVAATHAWAARLRT